MPKAKWGFPWEEEDMHPPKPVTNYDQSGVKLSFFERRRMRRWKEAVKKKEAEQRRRLEELTLPAPFLLDRGVLPTPERVRAVSDTHLGMQPSATPAGAQTSPLMTGHFSDIDSRNLGQLQRNWGEARAIGRTARVREGEIGGSEVLVSRDALGSRPPSTEEYYRTGVLHCDFCGEVVPEEMCTERQVFGGTLDPVATSMRRQYQQEQSFGLDFRSPELRVCQRCWVDMCEEVKGLVDKRLSGCGVGCGKEVYSGSLGRGAEGLLW